MTVFGNQKRVTKIVKFDEPSETNLVKEVIEELKPQSPFLKTTLSKKEVAKIDPVNHD